ncbi:glycosyltransferase [Iamia sp. SCSIO 61187]|uniref:glycosyltransferase n=1 Tax=Iamia sp. SCSIO 61187 TaxID=2722752 RepID=UPI001C631603|nr:glycosyltransferase [Iamia sp. SCSIO 61187]QYG92255.1 glycosyltransferase [Iamia sp. SCSIO 61187]
MIAAFWLAVAVIVETYVVFPAVVAARAVLRPLPLHGGPVTPTVSVVVAARDEEAELGAKLDSVVGSDYPADRLEVVVASDGSTDRTADVVRARGPRVRLVDLPPVGKAAALNAALAEATGEVVVFTDANSRFTPTTLAELVRPLADPTVGGVAGDQRYLPPDSEAGDAAGTTTGERRYWDFDRLLKVAESTGGNVISATGALYAVRRDLVGEVPAGVTDDFVTSTGVIAQGKRLVFASDAVVWEPVAASPDAEMARKVRVMTRGLQGVVLRRALLDPRRHGFYAVQLLHHKVLRRLMGVPLSVTAVAAALSWRRGSAYRAATLAQTGLYGLAVVGLTRPTSRLGRSRPCGMAAYFAMVNAAGLVAATNVLRGRRIEQWSPARRPEDGPG